MACEDYKKTKSPVKMAEKAKKIYEEFIQIEAPKEVSGHGAGDSSGRGEAAASVVSIPKGSDGCVAPHTLAEGLGGLHPQQPHPRVLHSHPSEPWCPSLHAQPCQGHLQHMPVPSPQRGFTAVIRDDGLGESSSLSSLCCRTDLILTDLPPVIPQISEPASVPPHNLCMVAGGRELVRGDAITHPSQG